MTTKPTNPKDAIGSLKILAFSVLPRRVVAEVALALLEGALKYGRHNYRASGVRASVYVDAMDRHMSAFWEGQDIDPDSGVSHVVKAIASLAVLRDGMLQGNWVDDRPPKASDAESWIARINKQTEAMISKYPNPKSALTQKAVEPPEIPLLTYQPDLEETVTAETDCTWEHGPERTCSGCDH